jgi:hypothetical protein
MVDAMSNYKSTSILTNPSEDSPSAVRLIRENVGGIKS